MPYSDPEKARACRRDYNGKRRAQLRAIAQAAKERPCADCGIQYPYYVMQFDHVRGTKVATVRELCAKVRRDAERKLYDEIAKCEVVCANCHALRHGGQCGPNNTVYVV